MKKNKPEGLEFEILEEESELLQDLPSRDDKGADEVIRKSYRTPFDQNHPAQVRVKGELWPVLNLSPGGLSFFTEREADLKAGENLSIELLFSDREVTPALQGQLVHATYSDDPKGLYCGLKFLDLRDEDKAVLEDVINTRRDDIFDNTGD